MTPADAAARFVATWERGEVDALREEHPRHDAPGDSTSALIAWAAAANLAPNGAVTTYTRGARSVARVGMYDTTEPPAVEATQVWLLLEEDEIRGGTPHTSVASVFLAGMLDAPVVWRSLPESPAARAWLTSVVGQVAELAPEVRQALGLRRKGRALGLHRTVTLGRAPRAAALIELRGADDAPTRLCWVLLDLDDEGRAAPVTALSELDVDALCRQVRGAIFPELEAAHTEDPVTEAMRHLLGEAPEAPRDVETATRLAEQLFVALAKGSIGALVQATPS